MIKTSDNTVLDGSRRLIQNQNYTKHISQLWRLSPHCDGTFYIINAKDGCVLDIEENAKEGTNVTKTILRYKIHQRWFINYNGIIVNADDHHLAIDVDGNIVNVQTKNDETQQFILSCVCCNLCFFSPMRCCWINKNKIFVVELHE